MNFPCAETKRQDVGMRTHRTGDVLEGFEYVNFNLCCSRLDGTESFEVYDREHVEKRQGKT